MTFVVCEKRQSIIDAKGHCLVLGGPGSGKTTLALVKATTDANRKLIDSQQALFLSFSRAAVARIADAAAGQFLPKDRPNLSVQTFHSFFWQILRAHGYLLGAPKTLSILLAHDEKAMRDGIDRDAPRWNEWEARRMEVFHREGRVSFDLFAPLTLKLLRDASVIRRRISNRFPLILVDEAQDTGNEQWECIRLLSENSQIVCLADPDQMIYDFIPGVGSERIAQIRGVLNPLEINLGGENQRSPGTEILAFAKDVLRRKVRPTPYKGVTRLRFRSSALERDKAIRSSIGILVRKIKDATGSKPSSIALITSYSSGVAIVSSALQQDRTIPHHVLFDEAFALLASRLAAFLLEPKTSSNHANDVATLLELAADALRAKGTNTALDQSRRLMLYGSQCRANATPKHKIVRAGEALITIARNRILTGDPRHDWTMLKQDLRTSGEAAFHEIASQLDYLVAFGRGKRIAENLSELWLKNSAYPGARRALDTALTQDQLLSAGEELKGIYVMNIHKCKGKQFDGVVLYRQQHHSPFVWRGELSPYSVSRRLLHVAITRARHHVLILDESFSVCPIISPYHF